MMEKKTAMHIGYQSKKIYFDLYRGEGNTKVCFYCGGAPFSLDNSKLLGLVREGYDVCAIEYSGSQRSEGLFSPGTVIASASYCFNQVANMGYEETILVCYSFGCLLAQYIDCTKCYLLAPILDPGSLGNMKNVDEDSISDFLSYINKETLYRGLETGEWADFLYNYEPNQLFDGRNITILHGKEDETVCYLRSENMKNDNVTVNIYPGIGHDEGRLVAELGKIVE